jgi:hypothetical protein
MGHKLDKEGMALMQEWGGWNNFIRDNVYISF